MDFPEFWNSVKWRVVKRAEDLWLNLSSGEERRIGTKTVYEKIVRAEESNEKVLEINLFNRGAIAHIWFPDVVRKPRLVYSRIMKDGKWVYGPIGETVSLDGLSRKKPDGRWQFCGIRVSLMVGLDNEVGVSVYK